MIFIDPSVHILHNLQLAPRAKAVKTYSEDAGERRNPRAGSSNSS